MPARIKQVRYYAKPSGAHHRWMYWSMPGPTKNKNEQQKSRYIKGISALYFVPCLGAITSLGNRNINLTLWLRKQRFGRAAYLNQRKNSRSFRGGPGDSGVPSKIERSTALLLGAFLITRSALDGVCAPSLPTSWSGMGLPTPGHHPCSEMPGSCLLGTSYLTLWPFPVAPALARSSWRASVWSRSWRRVTLSLDCLFRVCAWVWARLGVKETLQWNLL